jgi:hypothetical protein
MMRTVAGAVLALCLTGCTNLPMYSSIDDFPRAEVTRLHGQATDQVLSLLGQPTRKLPYAKGSEVWEYEGTRHAVVVYFDRQCPGRVCACSSGKTPEEAHRSLAQAPVRPPEGSGSTQ